MGAIQEFFEQYISWTTLTFRWTDIVEIIVFGVVIYYFISWIKRTKAWLLLKGIMIVVCIYGIAYMFSLNNIVFVFNNIAPYFITLAIVIFQPELRKMLEQLGNRNVLGDIFSFDDGKERAERFTTETIDAIVRATFELGRAKTGALIVIEQNILLTEYINTGITMDALVSAPLLIQIFEHNTPLHDGAIVIRGNRIVAATCYLPLSDSMDISKALGTRHRAALGISEVTDSITIIASEETGAISLAIGGTIYRDIDVDKLRTRLAFIQKKSYDVKRFRLWKGKRKDEE